MSIFYLKSFKEFLSHLKSLNSPTSVYKNVYDLAVPESHQDLHIGFHLFQGHFSIDLQMDHSLNRRSLL